MGHDQTSILSSSLFTPNWVLLSTDLCIFPYLFLRKQTSPSPSCRWSLPLISRKSHTFPLTPLKYCAVNLTPFPKCSSHNESRTPAGSNSAQSARLQKAQTMARLSSAEIPGSSQVQVLWGFLCLVRSSAHLQTFVFTVISPSSCKLIDPTTVNLGGSQKSNPWVYTLSVSRSTVWSSEVVWLLRLPCSFDRLLQSIQFLQSHVEKIIF